MYNYRQLKTDQEILWDVFVFCRQYHMSEDVIKHCLQTCENLFMIHECSLFNNPKEFNFELWKTIIACYMDYVEKSNLCFPDGAVKGPSYEYDDLQERWLNKHRRIIYEIPSFFGVKYMDDTSDPYGKIRLGIKPTPIIKKRRMLYDILYDVVHLNDKTENQTLFGEPNYNLGHLDDSSIFRFDQKANDEYRLAFDYISRALIYRFPLNSSMEKIRDAMHLELYASQIRSYSFSAIKKLTFPKYYEYFHCDVNRIKEKKYLNKHREKVYDHVINACNIQTITITETGKHDRETYPINMDYESEDSALYYAYLYFRNLSTDDYINEIDNLIKNTQIVLDKIIPFTHAYERARNLLVPHLCLEIPTDDDYDTYGLIQYASIPEFIDDNKDVIMKVAFIDDDSNRYSKAFYRRHKEYMCTFVDLYRNILYRKNEDYIYIAELLDLLHLYVRLKKNSVNIPTKTCGYIKDKSYKPVKVDYAMQLVQEEFNCRKTKTKVTNTLYMRNIIIETWLSSVFYIVLHNMSCDLFLKCIKATKLLFHKLLQEIPPITKVEDVDVDIQSIVEELLFKSKYND